jgi:hypothetical protein
MDEAFDTRTIATAGIAAKPFVAALTTGNLVVQFGSNSLPSFLNRAPLLFSLASSTGMQRADQRAETSP